MTQSVPRLLLVDNYDSFTYNLVQAFLVLGAEVLVHRNDAITIGQAQALQPTHLFQVLPLQVQLGLLRPPILQDFSARCTTPLEKLRKIQTSSPHTCACHLMYGRSSVARPMPISVLCLVTTPTA